MASNSKRRRRVLGASCILAALIIAASSFAWFTSKDEVSNRLSANADYGVSIVESFAPPKNWIPGQEVNKDVYAVNTGNIGAFVNEDVSGVMSVTYEIESDTFVQTSAVKLNDTEIAETMIDGATTKEGGAFLAYTTSSTPTGYLVSSRTEDDLTGAWHPTEEGVYIFRRSLDVATDGTETYTYDGYYFDGTTNYYKIKINSTTPAADSEGKLSAATYKYVLDLKETAKAVGLYYDEDNTRLVATYALNPAASMPYDPDAIAARKAVDLANATTAKNTANTNYNNAKDAMDKVNALINARNTVVDEAKKLNNLITTSADKKTAMDNADSTVGTKADAVKNAIPTLSATADDNTYTDPDITTSVNKYNGLITTVTGNISSLESALDAIKNVTSGTAVSDTLKDNAATALNTLKTNAQALYQAYAEIKEAGAEYDTNGTIKTALEGFLNDVNALDLTELNNAISAYNTAVTQNNTASIAINAADYNAALNDYSSKLSSVPSGVSTAGYTVDNTNAYTGATENTAVKNNAELSPYPMQNVTADTFKFTISGEEKTVAQWKAISDAADARVAEITARDGDYSPTSGNIEIYINLDPSFASYWKIEDGVKTKAVAPAEQETQEMVSFYLKHILDEGKTSEKLIDSVTLSPDTQNVFKSFDFDLNVGLDSAQITYADDQKTIKTDAVQAPAFGATPTLTTPTDINTALTWS